MFRAPSDALAPGRRYRCRIVPVGFFGAEGAPCEWSFAIKADYPLRRGAELSAGVRDGAERSLSHEEHRCTGHRAEVDAIGELLVDGEGLKGVRRPGSGMVAGRRGGAFEGGELLGHVGRPIQCV
ncbi:MAG: hypothetical protein IKO40_14440 [Kiritimatiellae bacterium]|nr:hypothetical protein [Kiritimatiellia bacterium]